MKKKKVVIEYGIAATTTVAALGAATGLLVEWSMMGPLERNPL